MKLLISGNYDVTRGLGARVRRLLRRTYREARYFVTKDCDQEQLLEAVLLLRAVDPDCEIYLGLEV